MKWSDSAALPKGLTVEPHRGCSYGARHPDGPGAWVLDDRTSAQAATLVLISE
jgi:hypothetical protein